MTKPVTYRVTREHRGDDLVEGEGGAPTFVAKHFAAGDTRVALPATVAALVAAGVLVEGEAEAAAPPPAPKPAKVAPKGKTKVDPAPKNKGAGK